MDRFAAAHRSLPTRTLEAQLLLRPPPLLPTCRCIHDQPRPSLASGLCALVASAQWNNAKQDAKRSLEGLERDGGGKLQVKTIGGAAGVAIDAVAGNTIGRVGKLAQEKLLGKMVDEALQGSFQETVVVGKSNNKQDGGAKDALSDDERDGLQQRIDDLASDIKVEKSMA